MYNKRLVAIVVIFSILSVFLTGCSGSKPIDSAAEPVANTVETDEDVFVPEPQPVVEIKEESFKLNADQLAAEFENCKINFSPFDLDGEKTLVISTVQPAPYQEELDHNYRANVYDFKLDGVDQFTDLIEITLPYDDSYIEPGADEYGSTFGMYFNESTSEWETVNYTVNTDNNTITIITDHLSKYGVFTVKNQNTRLARIASVMPYTNLVDSDTAKEIIGEAIENPNDEIAKAKDLAMSTTNDWLGLSSFLLTTSDPIYSSELMKGMGSTFNALGVAAAVYQLAIDMEKDPSPELYGNLSKNILNIGVSYWGTSAMQLSFAGVFAIDYSLTKFANAAWDGRNDSWYEAYKLHYNEKMQLKNREWYSKFYWLWVDSLKSKNPNALKEGIDKLIDDNVNAFWNNELVMADYHQEALGKGFTVGGGFNEGLKKKITAAKKAELVADLQPVFAQLKKRINWYLMDQYTKELNNVKAKYNQIINVTIEEIAPEGAPLKYAGHVIRFSPLAEDAKKSTWTGVLSSEGKASTKFTLLGYLQSGKPTKLDIYSPDSDLETSSPIHSVEFAMDKKSLYIPIGELPVQSGQNTLSDEKSIKMYNNYFNITTGFTLHSSHGFEIIAEKTAPGYEVTQYLLKLTEPIKQGQNAVIQIDAHVGGISHSDSDNISEIVVREAAWKGTTESSGGSITISIQPGDTSSQLVTYEVILDTVNQDGDVYYGGGAILYYIGINPYNE